MTAPTLRQMHPSEDFTALHALLTRCFAYMEGRIDPPSSLTRMTPEDLSQAAALGKVWVIEKAGQPIASITLTSRPRCLYLGKLAVLPEYRGARLARRLIAQAEASARQLGLPALRLQTRIELTENHATFSALGFRRIAETSHPGYDRPTSLAMERRIAL